MGRSVAVQLEVAADRRLWFRGAKLIILFGLAIIFLKFFAMMLRVAVVGSMAGDGDTACGGGQFMSVYFYRCAIDVDTARHTSSSHVLKIPLDGSGQEHVARAADHRGPDAVAGHIVDVEFHGGIGFRAVVGDVEVGMGRCGVCIGIDVKHLRQCALAHEQSGEDSSVLVAYFSAQGHTRSLAEKVAKATNGD